MNRSWPWRPIRSSTGLLPAFFIAARSAAHLRAAHRVVGVDADVGDGLGPSWLANNMFAGVGWASGPAAPVIR
jgi:hypothetical protein